MTERRKVDKAVIVCTALCVLCMFVVVVVSATVLDTSNRTDDLSSLAKANAARVHDVATLTKENAARVRDLARLTREIQVSRKDACEESNRRHDNTLRVLDARIKQLHGVELKRAQANRAATVALITALAPRRNCAEFVK